MIDIHTHILPAFDDGADNISDAALMLRMAYESGTSELIVTPHMINRYSSENYDEKISISDAFEKLCIIKKNYEIPIKLYYGAENYGSLILKNEHTHIVALNNTDYILLEFDFNESFENVKYITKKLLNKGYKIVIAHPERYEFVKQEPMPLHWFVNHECFLQLNKGSIHGRFGRRSEIASKYIVENRFASFVASDAHDPYNRTPVLEHEYVFYCDNYGIEYADMLFKNNPRLLLDNKELQVV